MNTSACRRTSRGTLTTPLRLLEVRVIRARIDEEVAAHIVKLPPLSVRMVKESITHSLDVPNLKDASLADLYRFGMLELTQDTQEAHNAWREKRAPVFKGD